MTHIRTLIALVSLAVTAVGCSSPPGKNNAQCTQAAVCDEDETEVDSCDGEEDCREVTTCGQTIFCVVDGGGGGGGDISASDYDQSCEFATDCELIYEGDPCECNVCFDGAINRSDLEAYQSDVVDASCEVMACPDVECEDTIRAFCIENVCEAKPTTLASTDDFDRSCDIAADCAGVFEGDVCAECQCPNAAVSASEVEQYREQFDPACAVPSPCDCAETPISCNDGVCEAGI